MFPPRALIHPDTRVEIDIPNIGNQLCDQNHQHRRNRTRQQQFNIVIAGRLNQCPAKALIVKQGFYNHYPGQQPWKLKHNYGKGRDKCIPQGMFQHDIVKADTFQTRGTYILGVITSAIEARVIRAI